MKQNDVVEKREGGKNKLEKPLTKREKSDTSHEEAGKGDKSTRKVERKSC